MSSLRKHRHFLVVCLVLAAVLYRGLIPAGFMPATAEMASHGTLLVICPHGEMGMHGHAGSGSGGASLEQCPFGAAAGPALPSVKLALSFDSDAFQFRPDWRTTAARGDSPHLLPPARAPPAFS